MGKTDIVNDGVGRGYTLLTSHCIVVPVARVIQTRKY